MFISLQNATVEVSDNYLIWVNLNTTFYFTKLNFKSVKYIKVRVMPCSIKNKGDTM